MEERTAMPIEPSERIPADRTQQQSEPYLRAVLDHVLDGIISINENRTVETFNSAAERIFGYAADEVIGQNVSMLMPEPYRSQHDTYVQNYLRTGVARIIGIGREVRGRRKNGEEFPLELGVSEMKVDGESKFIGILRDISERKRAEEELRRLNEELEERVISRTTELQAANLALQKSLSVLNETRDQLVQTEKMVALGELVAGVAHEINTPLGVCVTAASFLELKLNELSRHLAEAGMGCALPEKYLSTLNEAMASILTNLSRAAELVKSFKLVAVDQVSEEKRRFNVKEYVDKVLLSLRPKYKRTPYTIEVQCPEELEIFSYPGALSQIITNLVMNSLLHAFDGVARGKMTLDLSAARGGCVMRFADNGKGIPPEHLKKIYDPFFTTKRGHGGTGLGLHVVYNLVTRTLGGRIECASQLGRGTVFTISFPCPSDEPKAAGGQGSWT
jgi:PAS domain S-box-containing protein